MAGGCRSRSAASAAPTTRHDDRLDGRRRHPGRPAIGASDVFGYRAEQQRVSPHDLHATVLHLPGIDHTKLTCRYNGRDMRLTDVHGTLIPQIVAKSRSVGWVG